MKYGGQEHVEHLNNVLELLYKMTTDWEGKLYIGITPKRNYIKRMVELSITGYVEAALHELQHPKPSLPQDSPYLWTAPTYGTNSQLTPSPYTTPTLPPEKRTRLQRVIGKFQYYCQSIDVTMSITSKKNPYKKPQALSH